MPPSAGTAEMSHSTATPSRAPRRNAAKPPSGAWMVPARGAVAVVAERVGDVRRDGDESAGRDGDGLGLASDLEGELAFQDVEGIRVLAVDIRPGHALAGCTTRA